MNKTTSVLLDSEANLDRLFYLNDKIALGEDSVQELDVITTQLSTFCEALDDCWDTLQAIRDNENYENRRLDADAARAIRYA